MSRLSLRNRGNAPRLIHLHIFMLIILAASLISSVAVAQPRLFSVEIGAAEFMHGTSASLSPTWNKDVYQDLTINAIPQPVFYITFNEGDSFRFVVPASLFSSVQEFGSLGFTQYMYKLTYTSGRFVYPILPVPNKLLRIYEAFLAGEKYWNDAIALSGLNVKLSDPDQPIDVFIGHFSQETANAMGGYSAFSRQEIRLPQGISNEDIELTPLHELFHFVTFAVLRAEAGGQDDFNNWDNASDYRAGKFLWESTARWSEDEPIVVPPVPGRAAPYEADTSNRFFCLRFVKGYQTELFERNQYCAGLLIKYYTEQIGGGADGAEPEAILELIARAFRLNPQGLSRLGWVRALAEGLPADRFPGETWQERWQKFYTGFATTLLVQNAAIVEPDANGLFGIHDDGTNYIKKRPEGFSDWPRFYSDYLNVPYQARQTPAEDDAERARRLASIANTAELLPGASALFRIDATREYGPQMQDRSVFLYAFGIPGTSTFALRRKEPVRFYGEFSPFSLLEGFEFPPGKEDVVLQEPALGSDEVASDVFYVGLVNSGPEQVLRQTQWSYLISPRILGGGRDVPNPNYPEPVRLVSGAPVDRGSKTDFRNGDNFEFETKVTGRVHARGARWQDIPRDQRTIDLELICEGSDLPVRVSGDSRDGSMRVDVAEVKTGLDTRPTVYKYTFSGTIDKDNSVDGDCVARVSLTSLLNLGAGDSQVDESFAFHLNNTPPEIARFQVTSNETVIYDSEGNVRHRAMPENGVYALKLKVWFSTDLAENGASLSAGLHAPYNAFEIPANTDFSDAVFWSKWYPDADEDVSASLLQTELFVPESAVPNGGFLFFSIMAFSKDEIPLDADPVEPGEQRDNSHFVTLNLDDYFLATTSIETETQISSEVLDEQGYSAIEGRALFRPFQARYILRPVVPEDDDYLMYFPWPLDTAAWLSNWQNTLNELNADLAKKTATHNELGDRLEAALAAAQEGDAQEGDAQKIAELRQNLETVAREVATLVEKRNLVLEYDSDFRLMIRLLNGSGRYWCDNEDPGVVGVRFGGMEARVDYNSNSNSERDVVSGSSSTVISTTALLPAWSSNDISQDPQWLAKNLQWREMCPYMSIWRYDLPDLVRAKDIVLTPPDLSRLGLANLSMADLFEEALSKLRELSWRYSVESFNDAYEYWPDPSFREANPGAVFPPLVDGPLVRMRQARGWPYPVRDGTQKYYEQYTSDVQVYNTTETSETRLYQAENGRILLCESDSEYRNDYCREGDIFADGPMFLWNRVANTDDDFFGKARWVLEDSAPQLVTNYTHAPQLYSRTRTLTILGSLTNGRLVGSLWGESPANNYQLSVTWGKYPQTIAYTTTRYRWAIEWQGQPAGEFPWPLETAPVASDPGPGGAGAEGDQQAEGDNPEDGGPNDNPLDGGTNAANNNPPETTPAPGENGEEGNGGWPNPLAATEPTLTYPGVIQGVVAHDRDQYGPGNIVVYLQGDTLPPPNEQPGQMELNDGFPRSFVAIPVGSSIRFHNGEGKKGPTYRISAAGEVAGFDYVIAPGKEQIVEFTKEGRLTIRTDAGEERTLEVLVLPGTRFNVLESNSYIIRDVPPGTYLLSVKTQSRRYQPMTMQIEIPSSGRAQQDITLRLR